MLKDKLTPCPGEGKDRDPCGEFEGRGQPTRVGPPAGVDRVQSEALRRPRNRQGATQQGTKEAENVKLEDG